MGRAERGDCAGSLGRALVALPALLIWAGPLMAQTSEQVQKAADEAIRRLDLQTEFPRGPEPLSWHLDLPPETLWVVLAIALAILAYAFRDLIPILRAGSGGIAQAEETAPGDHPLAVHRHVDDRLREHGRSPSPGCAGRTE